MTKPWIGLALTASLTLTIPALTTPARAADRTTVGVGTGAVAGALVGGPIGAVVGAVAGGFIGANSGGTRPRRHRRARASARRSAAVAAPRPEARIAREASAVPAASEISTAPRPVGTGGWRDPR